ncbi:unnamed protein product [Porites evermanni]|uniref:Uncharacterized protein n=1 Tax=Porites evermanni TaxID=104178 RepID=A0ABN8LWA3_9CNID|nr:unnamed protein product [Porites evermanni]
MFRSQQLAVIVALCILGSFTAAKAPDSLSNKNKKVSASATPDQTSNGREYLGECSCCSDHRSQWGLDNSQSRSANVSRVDDPRSEPSVLHELTLKNMAEDAESDIAIRFVDEND